MQDRVPANPGRVLITPENGTAAYYATMTRADNPTQEGTPLNKSTFLRDATAALFGLGTDAVPDDVLAWLGRFNQHCWKRTKYGASYTVGGSTSLIVQDASTNGTERTVYYADEINLDLATKEINLVNPSTVAVSYSTFVNTTAPLLKGKYVKNVYAGGVWYIDANASCKTNKVSSSQYQCLVNSGAHLLTVVPNDTVDYVYSADRNAYPDSGVSGDYRYDYCGVPFENTVTAPKIATGSYVGTETYGSTSPNTLEVGFTPRLIVLRDEEGKNILIATYGTPTVNVSTTTSVQLVYLTWGETSLSWYYASSAGLQFNTSGEVYHYAVIG